jgi:hypothetical protein
MIALYNFLPLYCPSCGTHTRLDHADNILRGKFKAKQALSCGVCGLRYQLADNTELFRAATASGGDLVEYFMGEDDYLEPGNGK